MRKNRIAAAVSAVVMAAGAVGLVPGTESNQRTLAETVNNKACIYGDLNGDVMVDTTDLTLLSLHLLRDNIIEDRAVLEAADIQYDGKVDLADLAALIQYISKKRDSIGKVTSETLPELNTENLKQIGETLGADGYINFVCNSTPLVLLDTIDENGSLNTVYSPISYYTALSMTAECAANSTRDEIIKALCADDMDDLRSENDALYRTVYFDDKDIYCKSANSLWMNNIYTFEKDTVEQIESEYGASAFEKNYYDTTGTAKEISDWIYEHTDNKIRPDVTIEDPEYELLRIINTIVYKNVWEDYFYNEHDEDFHREDGRDIKCSFIESDKECRVGAGERYTICEKKMKNGFTMNFVLPDEGTDIKDIISDARDMTDIYGKNNTYRNVEVDLYLPVFDIASKFDLSEATEALGIKEAFNENGADFTALVDPVKNDLYEKPAKISKITQEAVISVDKKGSEAAAYTEVVMSAVPSCAPMDNKEKIIIKFNRPFFYYITNNFDVPVFSGIVGDPTEK